MSRRTFIAGDIPDHVCQQLSGFARQLATGWRAGQVRWTPAQNMHITLRFLGETHDQQIPQVVDCLRTRCSEVAPIELALDSLGAFPNVRQPRVIWVGLAGQMADQGGLQGHLEEDVRHLGWEAEDRTFRPHLTLGRPRRDVMPLRGPPGPGST